MQWLNELPFADNRVLQIGFLAACGIAALIVLAIVYRLTFAHRLRVPGGRTRQPRLGLVDAFSLDGQRQLVLIRRDNIEHLVMIGGPNDVLVESQINRAVVPARESNQASPLLVPSTPVRRTEAAALPASPAAVTETPPKVAAKVVASPPAPPPLAPVPAAPAAPTVATPAPKAPASAQPTPPVSAAVPAQASVPVQARRARTGAPSLGAADGDTSSRARSTSAGESAASGGPASRSTARDHAPADHPRQRLAESRGAGSRCGNSSRTRPGQPLGPVSCRACAAAPPGESGAGSCGLEGGVSRSNGENGGARGANSDDRPAGQRGLGPSAACAENRPIGAGLRLGAKISRRPPARGQDERVAERQAQSRRSLRRPRFARGGDGASAWPRKIRLNEAAGLRLDSRRRRRQQSRESRRRPVLG